MLHLRLVAGPRDLAALRSGIDAADQALAVLGRLSDPPSEIAAAMAALRKPPRELAQELSQALADELPAFKRDGGFVRAGYQAALDETRALRDESRRVVAATLLGAGAIAADIGLLGTAAWLISKAAQHPNEATLAVAIVAVQFFGLSRGFLRYEERLVGHDAAFRLLADLRQRHVRLDRPIPIGTAGGTLQVELNHSDPGVLPPGFRADSNDARILACALNLAAETEGVAAIMASRVMIDGPDGQVRATGRNRRTIQGGASPTRSSSRTFPM